MAGKPLQYHGSIGPLRWLNAVAWPAGTAGFEAARAVRLVLRNGGIDHHFTGTPGQAAAHKIVKCLKENCCIVEKSGKPFVKRRAH